MASQHSAGHSLSFIIMRPICEAGESCSLMWLSCLMQYVYFLWYPIPIILWFLVFCRSLRNKLPKQILISFCFSLLSLYVVFVFGIERTKPEAVCVSVSVLLHYFTLTSIAWMAVEAFHMYVSFVHVVGRWAHISKFLLKASLLAWGKRNIYSVPRGEDFHIIYCFTLISRSNVWCF